MSDVGCAWLIFIALVVGLVGFLLGLLMTAPPPAQPIHTEWYEITPPEPYQGYRCFDPVNRDGMVCLPR